ncbi:MAG: nitroreductase/quinone reductase family protein [Gammaproteobacteria bacterium]|nr:nitroreductase/quinone reductase family protein [Gammaproteobacteria bacterium]
MRIPEFLFPIINRVMKLLLASPAHGLLSGSIMTIHFTGRRTGRARSTPVRYIREDLTTVTCLTGRQTRWWQNFLSPAEVQLQIAGRRVAAVAYSAPDDTARIEAALKETLDRFPGDAPYHGLTRSPTPQAFAAAVANDVIVTFTLRD